MQLCSETVWKTIPRIKAAAMSGGKGAFAGQQGHRSVL